jgi:hypothetical protein
MYDRQMDAALPPVGALLRRPAVLVRHEVMDSLHAAGFDDVLPAHLGVFQYPGPDGQRPGVLALRTKTRVVRLTERGWAASEVIRDTTLRLERQWSQALGDAVYEDLARALMKLEAIFDEQVTTGAR